jgi:hypothetical protein
MVDTCLRNTRDGWVEPSFGSAVVSFTHPADLDLDTLAGLLDRTSLLTLPDR